MELTYSAVVAYSADLVYGTDIAYDSENACITDIAYSADSAGTVNDTERFKKKKENKKKFPLLLNL